MLLYVKQIYQDIGQNSTSQVFMKNNLTTVV